MSVSIKGPRKVVSLPSGRVLDYTTSPIIMGVLNVTPDSFYAGSRAVEVKDALMKVEEMVRSGADLIDIGGESTRPGALPVSLEEEKWRVIPVIKEIKRNFDIPISIDTYKSEVASRAIESGAEIVNDISGLRFDSQMVDVIALNETPVVVMHMKGTPRDMQKDPRYEDVVGEIKEYFNERVEFLSSKGIRKEKIIIDPGIGFGKKAEHNIEIVKNIGSFIETGFPVLVGHSRKSFLGHLIDEPSPEHRLEATLALTVYLALKGVAILRVHDVDANKKVIKVMEALYEGS